MKAFLSLGGNFLRAVPETRRMEPAWREVPLSVQIATKLNRSQVLHGRTAFLLPCLGRIDFDRQQGGLRSVAVDDSTGCMHGWRGRVESFPRHRRHGFTEGSVVIASTFADVTAHDIPKGSCAGYYPELNPLIPLWRRAEESKVPAAKNIPIVLRCHRSPLR